MNNVYFFGKKKNNAKINTLSKSKLKEIVETMQTFLKKGNK